MSAVRMGRLRELLFVSAILLLAAFLRLYRLDQLPPGLHYDEAFKGVEARAILGGGGIPLFFPENFGELPLRIYATALNFALFGESPWSLRLVSAFAGVLTVAALYALARNLLRSRPVALLAAFILAILYWHIDFSRLGMEPILTPLAMTLAFAFLWQGLRSRRAGWFALAGVCFGATVYTYQAAAFIPVLLAIFAAVEILVNRPFWQQHARGLIVCAAVALVTIAPLGLYFVSHSNQLLQRPGDVVVASSDSSSTLDNALKVAGMFFVRGDANPRSNLPLRPALDPFLAIGFIAGLATCLARLRRVESRLLLLWLVVMSVPSIITEFAPHFGRTIGVVPALALITAHGFGTLLALRPDRRHALALVLVIGLAASTGLAARDYFQVWAGDPGLFDAFDAGYWSLAQKLRARPANEAVYVSPVDSQNYTLQFGLNRRDARSFDGRGALVLPPAGTAAVYGIVTREDTRALARLKTIFPQGTVVDTVSDAMGRPFAFLYRTDGVPQLAPGRIVRAQLGNVIQLSGYDFKREDGSLVVSIQWGSIAETETDYTAFVHILGPANAAAGSTVVAQDDAMPGHGSYPTSRWQAGEVILDEYRLTLPTDLPAGTYGVEIGMYNLQTRTRLAVTDANGRPMESDRILDQIALP